MRRVFRFVAIVAVVASAFVFTLTSARPAAASCVLADLVGPASGTLTFGAGGNYVVTAYLNGTFLTSYTLGSPGTTVVLPYFITSGYEFVITDTVNNCSSIPSGFVLKTVTCNTAVFDAAGGNPVSGATITAGQTWYVNPKSVTDAKGKSWTEIYVSGQLNGFVWTSCVK